MLVDLACNDVGRVAEFGSVTVPEYLRVHRYSKIMHLASVVEGRLRGRAGRLRCVAGHPAGGDSVRRAQDPGLPDHR